MNQKFNTAEFKNNLEVISGQEISEQEAAEAGSNLLGFLQTLIEIDKSLKNKGNENANIRSSNIIY